MSAQDSCLSLIKYLLFVFNLFFFVSCLVAIQPGPQALPSPPPHPPTLVSLLAHHHILLSSPKVLGSLIFCFGIWILVDKTSFVSFVGEGAGQSGRAFLEQRGPNLPASSLLGSPLPQGAPRCPVLQAGPRLCKACHCHASPSLTVFL